MAFLRYFRPDVPMDDSKLAGIAQELGDLPLALHLTGSFLRTYRSTSFGDPPAYLNQLRQDQVLGHASLQGRGAGVSPTRHDLNVDRMISLGYGQLCPRDPLDQVALGVLDRVACFALGVPIPPGLLMAAITGVVEDELQAEDALVRLVDLGLLERQADGSTRMHQLVATFVHSRDAAPEAQSAVEDAVLVKAKSANASGDPRSLLAWQARQFTHLVMLKLLLFTGIRNAELVQLRLADVDLHTCQLRICQGKGRKDRYVLFPTSFRGELAQYIERQRLEGVTYLFESNRYRPCSTRRIRQIVTHYARAAGIEKRVYPHLFRHQLITYLTKQGIISPKLQLLSCHTIEQSLAVYRELALSDVAQEYEMAMRTFPVR